MASSRASFLGFFSTSTGASVMLSITVMCANRLKDWKTMPICARSAASSLPSCGMRSPPMRMSPLSIVSSRLTVRHSVDLPEPDGPMMITTSPRRTLRETSFSTCS